MKLVENICLLMLTIFIVPLMGQGGVEHIEAIQEARFPSAAKQVIKYATEKNITVRFALMSEVYELMSYDNTDVFTKYNRNISVDESIKYYNQSHKDFFGVDHTVLPFAVSTNHYHDDKVDFLAIIHSKSKNINGRVLYSNVDYTQNYPALVAPNFQTLFVDFRARIDAAHEAGEKEVFFELTDYFTAHTFDFDLNKSKEQIRVEAPIVTSSNTAVLPKITSKIAVENIPNEGQRILINFTFSIGRQTISQNFYLADLLRFYIQDEFVNKYIVSAEYRRKYTAYIWCADKFLKSLQELGGEYRPFLDNVSMSTTFRYALWTQGESLSEDKSKDYEGVLNFDDQEFQFTLGEDKTSVEDADEDLYYEDFVKNLRPKWVNGVNDELVVKVIGLRPDRENIGWYDLICEIIEDKYASDNNGGILYVESFAPYTEQKYSQSTSRKVYDSVDQLIAANSFKRHLDGLIVEKKIQVNGLDIDLYNTASVGRKRFLPFLQIEVEPSNNEHIIKLDYQFSFDRYQKVLRINESAGISRERLYEVLKSMVLQLAEEDGKLNTLVESIDVEQLINLAL